MEEEKRGREGRRKEKERKTTRRRREEEKAYSSIESAKDTSFTLPDSTKRIQSSEMYLFDLNDLVP